MSYVKRLLPEIRAMLSVADRNAGLMETRENRK